jgi:hypothetical protein
MLYSDLEFLLRLKNGNPFGGEPMTKRWGHLFVFLIIAAALLFGGYSCKKADVETEKSWKMDGRSYQLGVIAAFSEIVAVGVKKLALSAPLSPEEMTQLLPEAEKIAAENGALIYLEKDFLVTDLFPEDITRDKHVLLIYLDPIKDEYFALKSQKEELIEKGLYRGELRTEIARQMGRLLSYPEERIEKMLEKDKN